MTNAGERSRANQEEEEEVRATASFFTSDGPGEPSVKLEEPNDDVVVLSDTEVSLVIKKEENADMLDMDAIPLFVGPAQQPRHPVSQAPHTHGPTQGEISRRVEVIDLTAESDEEGRRPTTTRAVATSSAQTTTAEFSLLNIQSSQPIGTKTNKTSKMDKMEIDLPREPTPPAILPPEVATPSQTQAPGVIVASVPTSSGANNRKRAREDEPDKTTHEQVNTFEPVPSPPVVKPKLLLIHAESIVDGRDALNYTIRHVCEKMGYPVPPTFDATTWISENPGLVRVYQHLCGGKIANEEQWKVWWKLHGETLMTKDCQEKIKLYPGVVRLLVEARKHKIPRLMLTNDHDRVTDLMKGWKVVSLFNGYIEDRGRSSVNFNVFKEEKIMPWWKHVVGPTSELDNKDIMYCYTSMLEFQAVKRHDVRGCWIDLYNMPKTPERMSVPELIVADLEELRKKLFEEREWKDKDTGRAHVSNVDDKEVIYIEEDTPEPLRLPSEAPVADSTPKQNPQDAA